MRDMMLTSNGPWEYDPVDINTKEVPAVVFQGTADVNVSLEMAKWWEGKLKGGCTAKFFEGEGHLTLVANHAAEMVAMMGQSAARGSKGAE
jgi:surfactin synthase thioesterase subunit